MDNDLIENENHSSDEDNDHNSTSSSSDDDDVEMHPDNDESVDYDEVSETVEGLKRELSLNPYHYESHVQLIAAMKKLRCSKEIMKARESMSSIFPLTEQLWMDWIRDEEDGDKKLKLLERAVEDYDSTQVWLELAFHQMKRQEISDYEAKVREVFERALTHVGLHSNEGSLVWDAYREFELALLAGMQPLPGSMPTNEQQALMNEQTQRVVKLFARQLSCPLIDIEKTFEEYKEWTEQVEPQVSKKFEDSLQTLKTFQQFEEKLIESNSLENYNAYIDHALANFDPNHIVCLFERAIKDHSIQSGLWIKYLQYIEKNLKIRSVVLRTYGRSIRNCPWCLDLWLGYLRALEKYSASHDQIRGAFNDALSVGLCQAAEYLALWTTYIDYLRRRVDWSKGLDGVESELRDLREAFDNANHQLSLTFSDAGDPTCSLMQYQAFIEAKYCQNMPKAREIFATIMQYGLANQASSWLQYIQLERSYGDAKHCRKVFQRALNSVNDWPEYITEAYIRFEREEGDLDHFLEASEKCRAQMQRIQERRAKEAEKEPKNEQKGKVKRLERQQNKKNNNNAFAEEHGRGCKKKQSPNKSKKINYNNANNNNNNNNKSSGWNQADEPVNSSDVKPYIKTRPKVFVRSDLKEGIPVVDSDGFKIPPPPSPSSSSSSSSLLSLPPPGYNRKRAAADDDNDDNKQLKKFKGSECDLQNPAAIGPHQTKSGKSNDMATVFISNLDYSVTKEEIGKIFREVGDIKDIRLVTNFKGKSKGYAYVEFVDELLAAEAMKLDRKAIGDRPMFVSKYNAQNKNNESRLKFNTGLEKNKLFVKNLSVDTTKETLEDVFKQVGPLKEVRIVTYRSGRPKGLAYVEYQDEASATRAVIELDGRDVDGHAMSVAISNPPPQKGKATMSTFTPSLGGGKKESRGGARNQLSMVPRNVAKRIEGGGQVSSDLESQLTDSEKMSNQDFRSMLLKK